MWKEQKIDTWIVANSTLRNVETVGMNAEVTSVSGANLGDLATTIAEEHESLDKNMVDIVIVGGSNDIVDKFNHIKNCDFETNMLLTIEKINKTLESVRFRNAYISEPLLNDTTNNEMEERIKICKRYLSQLEDMRNDTF